MREKNSDKDPKKLLQLAKSGDADAFGRLYEIYFLPIFRYIFLRVKDKEAADDLTQNVFLKVFRSIDKYKEGSQSPLAYFFAVARNTVIDYWRKKKEVKIDDFEKFSANAEALTENPKDLFEKKEILAAINRALSNLTEKQQEVIILKFISGLSNQEISQFLGESEEAIRQLQCRALKKLREHFKDNKII